MNKLENIVSMLFDENSVSKINGFSYFENVKKFYKDNNLSIPVSLTFTQVKSACRLTKDEIISIQNTYISELQAGTVTNEAKNNFDAIGNEDAKVTFTKNYTFSDAIEIEPLRAVGAKLVELLTVPMQEKFQNEIRKNNRALFDVSEIPAIIKILQKMQDSPKDESK